MQRIEASRVLFVDTTPRPLGWLSQAGWLRDPNRVGARTPRILGEYALVLLLSGGGFYRDTRGTHASVGPGQALLIFPELGHTYGPYPGSNPRHPSHWDELFVCFQGSVFDLWRREGLLDEGTPIWNVPNVASTLARLEDLISWPRPATAHENRAQLHQFLAILSDLTPAREAKPSEPSWLSTTRAALRAELEKDVSLESLGRDVGFSAEALRKAFTRATGTSPAQFRAQARLEAAKTLLQRGDFTHAAIAHSLGFNDEAHFSRRFKAMVGVSPREWRTSQKPND